MIYDLIVIGGGPGGYLAAERAGQAGLSVLLFEKRALGGVCLNEGCIPSKALLNSAKIADYAKAGKKYGVIAENVSIDHQAVVKRKDKVVKTLVAGVSIKMKKNKVTVVNNEAVIRGRSTDGFVVRAGEEEYTGKRLVIATGSVPSMPPIPGLHEGYGKGYVLTNREILDLAEVPGKLVIIGGGVIGLEMASYFNSAGSHVTVIEMLDHIAGPVDREISTILLNSYRKKGVDFRLSAKVTGITDKEVIFETKDGQQSVPFDKVLVSIGRRPAIEGIGLENIGVETERGRIPTDGQMKTNIPGVYAIGDVNGVSMLAHTAYREAEVCINDILGKRDTMRYNAVPSVIYTNPEVGCVGETGETAKEKGLDVEIVKLPLTYSGRYIAENAETDGILKVIMNRKYRTILGVHMIGSYASEIIYGAAMMIESEMRVEDIRQIVFPHPTVGEVLREIMWEL
ncbi:MAG: dihydrolipoyl dehydrogenase [Clostridiaceae bacterium]|nr:dihydrolipoyl dehydrogenase [Clostridiaceae bacterium]